MSPARDRAAETSAASRLERLWNAAAFVPLLGAALAFAAFVPTLMPGVANWDTAEFQTVGPVLGTAHPTGYASYVILGWLASIVLLPFGEPAYRMNLLQAITAAGAVAGCVAIVTQLGGLRWIAFATGLALASTTLFWRLSTHADPHMFHVALTAGIFVLLLGWESRRRSKLEARRARADRWLVAATFAYGVAVANHSLALLLAPGIGLFVLAVEPRIVLRPRLVATCLGVLAVTVAGFMLELPIRAAMHAPLVYARPDTWDGFWYIVLAEQFRGSLYDPLGHLGDKASHVWTLLSTWLGPLTYLAVGGLAVAVVRRPRYAILSGVSFIVTCVFSASYVNADIERYYLGPLLIAFTWAGLALATIASVFGWALAQSEIEGAAGRLRDAVTRPGGLRASLGRWAVADAEEPGSAVRPPIPRLDAEPPNVWPRAQQLSRLAALALAVPLLFSVAGLVPERLQPKSAEHPGGVSEANDTQDGEWLRAVLAAPAAGGVPENSVIVSWWSESTRLWYGQRVLHMRPDVWIIDDRTLLDDHLGEAPDAVRLVLGKRPVFILRVDGGGPGDWPAMRRQFELRQFKLPGGWQITQVIGRKG